MSAGSPKALLGELEHLIVLAVLRLGNLAHAPAVADEILNRTDIRFTRGTVFVALERLERKGYLRSQFGAPTSERGGKAKRLFSLTAEGKRAMARIDDALARMRPEEVQEDLG